MKKKYRLKYSAKDEYQKAVGVKTIQLRGSCDCLIINRLKYKDTYTNQQHAYSVYNNTPINKAIKVTNTCGIEQCIKKEHLVAKYHPTKDDIEYIKLNKMMGIDYLSHVLKIPEDLLQEFL